MNEKVCSWLECAAPGGVDAKALIVLSKGSMVGSRKSGYAARRSYRWCRPPTWGMATIRPLSGLSTALGSGASFARAKCVRDFSFHTTDQSFHIRILPRRTRSRDHLFDPHALGEGNECSPENRIPIPNQILWRFPWQRFSNLLCRPLFARMIRHVEVHHTAAVMRQDDENKQHAEGRGRHGKEIRRGHLLHVICQETPPGL